MRPLSFSVPVTFAAIAALSFAACSSQDSSVGDGGNKLGTSAAAGGQSGAGGIGAAGGQSGSPGVAGHGGSVSPGGHGGTPGGGGQGGAVAGGSGGSGAGAPCGPPGGSCPSDQYCKFPANDPCGATFPDQSMGHCAPRPLACGASCSQYSVCGCDGNGYCSACDAARAGVDLTGETIKEPGKCGASGMAGAAGSGGGCSKGSDGGALVDCGGSCVDTQSDASNCGACGVSCAAGQACQQGVCASGGTGGAGGAGGACKTNSDCSCGCACVNGACGDCTGAIPPSCTTDADCGPACAGLICAGGTCHPHPVDCGTGQINCGGFCVDTAHDTSNCGSCGTVCPGGVGQALCLGGQCSLEACPPNQTVCNGSCVDLQSSSANCGACGAACPAGSSCAAGVCSGGSGACVSDAGCGQGQNCKSGECLVMTQGGGAACGCSSDCATEQVCVSGACAVIPGSPLLPQQALPISAPGCDPTNPACKPVYAQFTVPGTQTITSVELYLDATVPAGSFLGMELAHVDGAGAQVTLANLKYPAGLCSKTSWVGSFPRTITPTDGFGTGQDNLGVFAGTDAKGTWLLKIHNNTAGAPAVVINNVALIIH